MNKLLLSLVVLASTMTATAGEWHGRVMLGSYHLTSSADGTMNYDHVDHWTNSFGEKITVNETNPGVGISYETGKWETGITYVHKNSLGQRSSTYVTTEYKFIDTKYVDVSVGGGFATGYQKSVVPTAGLKATIGDRVEIGYIPGIELGKLFGYSLHGAEDPSVSVFTFGVKLF